MPSLETRVRMPCGLMGIIYDSQNRRRLKEYPTGVRDEYFYDPGHGLLVDQGNESLVEAGEHPVDEYC